MQNLNPKMLRSGLKLILTTTECLRVISLGTWADRKLALMSPDHIQIWVSLKGLFIVRWCDFLSPCFGCFFVTPEMFSTDAPLCIDSGIQIYELQLRRLAALTKTKSVVSVDVSEPAVDVSGENHGVMTPLTSCGD